MTGEAGGGEDEPTEDPPEDVFSVLGDETRLRILLELADRSEPEGSADPVPFSELRRAVGVEDAGRFSYHLDKLREGFVTKDEAGYSPTVAGLQVASSIHAGRYAPGSTELSPETDLDCPVCGDPSDVDYDGGTLTAECESGHEWLSYPVPAGATVGRTAEELRTVTFQRLSMNLELARTGVCPRCWGTTTVDVAPPDGTHEVFADDAPRAIVECDRCWLAYQVTVSDLLMRSPPVVAFYHDHGLRPHEALERESVPDNVDVSFQAEDPTPVALELTLEGDRLALEVDGDCRIVDYERS